MNKNITILIPVFNEETVILHFYKALFSILEQIEKYDFSICFVDDGSMDKTLIVLTQIAKKDPRVKILSLLRNFGKEAALTAGLMELKISDAVIMMDADMEHPPHLIIDLIKGWEKGYMVVTTVRKSKKSFNPLRTFCSYLFYKIMHRVSEFKTMPKSTDYRLIDRSVINELKKFREKNRFVRGLIDWMGYKTYYIEFQSEKRFGSGRGRYSYLKLIKLALHSLTSFSLFPLRLVGTLGIVITLIFLAILFFMLFDYLFFSIFNYSVLIFLLVLNGLVVGVTLSAIGILALYVGDIHTEINKRPLYLIREKINF